MNKQKITLIFIGIIILAGLLSLGVYLYNLKKPVEPVKNSGNEQVQKKEEPRIENVGVITVCQYKCGDGICQKDDGVCNDMNCICAETPKDCPEDCK